MPVGANKAAIMGVSGVSTGDVVLISSQTASNSASLTFSSGISSTYGEYIFKFYNINPATESVNLTFQANAVDASGYNETLTSTFFRAKHDEADSTTSVAYIAGADQAQGTAFQQLAYSIDDDADASANGELHLFNPSSTTYVKHWLSRFSLQDQTPMEMDQYAAGYFNITTAIDDVQFKMSSGNFDGKIKMWGVK